MDPANVIMPGDAVSPGLRDFYSSPFFATHQQKLFHAFWQLLIGNFTDGERLVTHYYYLYKISMMVTRQEDVLFARLEGLIATYLEQVSRDVLEQTDEEFLGTLTNKWSNYRVGLRMIADVVLFMDRVCPSTTAGDLGMLLFRNGIVGRKDIREKIRVRLVDCRRLGEVVNADVLRNAYEMLMELDVYQEVCHSPYLTRYAQLLGQVQNCIQLVAGTADQRVSLFGGDCEYRYNISDFRGAGAFGFVYGATVIGKRKIGSTPAAVKVVHLNMGLLEDTNKWNMWCGLLRVVSELRHRNVVRYQKVVMTRATTGAAVEIVMELCERDLSSLLKELRENNTQLHHRTAVRYAREITAGLSFLHYNDIIHGDLKPGNILVKYDCTRKCLYMLIGDLDGSVAMQQFNTFSSDANKVGGTLRYMAPEVLTRSVLQLDGEMPGRKSDIWSLGCVILDLAGCVTGDHKKYIHKDSDRIEIGARLEDFAFIDWVQRGYVPFVDKAIPAVLANRIRQCLCVRKDDRTSAHELLQVLQKKE